MSKLRLASTLVLTGTLATAVAMMGCGGAEKGTASAGGGGGSPSGAPKGGGDSGAPKASGGTMTAVKGDGAGALKGRVSFAGDPPKPGAYPFKDATNKSDIPVCEQGSDDEKTFPTWRISPNKGLANVVIWVTPPANSYFELTDAQKKPTVMEKKIDQPHCAFVPHVDVYFPSYFDGKQQTPTGQKLNVVNTATINHNTTWSGNSTLNPGDNKLIPSKGSPMPLEVKPSKPKDVGKYDVLTLKCSIHSWMTAFVVVVDTPFAAVSDKDGNFQINDVPAGTKLTLKYWHESFDKPKSEEITVAKTGTTKDLSIGK